MQGFRVKGFRVRSLDYSSYWGLKRCISCSFLGFHSVSATDFLSTVRYPRRLRKLLPTKTQVVGLEWVFSTQYLSTWGLDDCTCIAGFWVIIWFPEGPSTQFLYTYLIPVS